jgi:hypothetical protein
MGGGLTKNDLRRACCNSSGGIFTAVRKLNAGMPNAHTTSRMKGNKLDGASKALIAGLVWVYVEIS